MEMFFPIAFKDFDKEQTDTLNKYTSEAGKWKVETKKKAEKNSFAVNPTSTNDGKIFVDVEGLIQEYGVGYKFNFTPDDLQGVKTTVSYTYMGQRLEGIVSRKGNQMGFEATQSGVVPLPSIGFVHLSTKANKDIADAAVALNLGGFLVGGQGIVDVHSQKVKEWNAGIACRNMMSGMNVSVKTKQMESYTIAASVPAPVHPLFSPRCVGLFNYNPKTKELDGEGGMEVPCPIIPGNTLKVRSNKQKDWRLTYIARLPGNWLCAVSMDKNKKTGVVLSQS